MPNFLQFLKHHDGTDSKSLRNMHMCLPCAQVSCVNGGPFFAGEQIRRCRISPWFMPRTIAYFTKATAVGMSRLPGCPQQPCHCHSCPSSRKPALLKPTATPHPVCHLSHCFSLAAAWCVVLFRAFTTLLFNFSMLHQNLGRRTWISVILTTRPVNLGKKTSIMIMIKRIVIQKMEKNHKIYAT